MAPVRGVLREAGSDFDPSNMIVRLMSDGTIGYEDLIAGAKEALMGSLTQSVALVARLLSPAMLLAVLSELMGEGSRKALAAGFLCYLSVALTLMDSFRSATGEVLFLSKHVGQFIGALFPLLSTLLVACGAHFGAAAYSPLSVLGAGILSGVVGKVSLGLCSLASVAVVFGSLSERFSLGKLTSLCKSLLTWVLGLALTGFLGLIAAQNLLSGAQDSAALRASKYAAKNLIPGVGNEVADALFAISGSAIAVKNAAGIAGIAALIVFCMAPVVRIFCAMLAARVAAALLEPLGSSMLTKLIDRFAELFSMLLVAGCASVVVGIILIGAVLGAGNVIAVA